MKISGGMQEDGIVIGNNYDKYGSQNPLVKWIMSGFNTSLSELVTQAAPKTIHEIGCGEGFWVMDWTKKGMLAKGCDFSPKVIKIARQNAESQDLNPSIFSVASIYELQPERDSADLVVCCEVLEHLEEPEVAMASLQRITQNYLILSVPREPVWRILNIARGKYLRALGNTPGHIQHWSKMQFVELASTFFNVVKINTPLPWTMLLCQPLDYER